MSLLVAVKSCEADMNRGLHEAIRQTWGQDIAPVYFFMGNADGTYSSSKNDEIELNCLDGYNDLPFKTREILRWMLRGPYYEHVLLVDTDTYLVPRKVKTIGYENYDYMGVNSRPFGQTFPYHAPGRDGMVWYGDKTYPWMSGGFGYFLSRKAAEMIVKVDPNMWAEDMFCGQILGPHYNTGEIKMMNIQPNQMSFHHPHTKEPTAQWQHRMYQECR